MQLALGQVRKAIREMRKSLRDLPSNPPQKAVHNLRTRSRRVEAISAALLPRNKDDTHQLLKSIKPLRKAAGDVRDMDVLEAKARQLLRRNHDASFERLIAHIRAMRAEGARELVVSFSSERKTIQRGLKRFSKYVEDTFSETPPDARQAHKLFGELCRWPRLSARNLHDFRIKLKELRYMMQLMPNSNTAFMNALENARGRIGAWHDWEELRRIAAEVLDAKIDRTGIAAIAEIEAKKFSLAMRAAQSLRTRYLKTHSALEIAEP
jgi:CHAD domain-containing protein